MRCELCQICVIYLGADVFNLSVGSDRVMDFEVSEGDLISIRPGVSYSIRSQGADLLISTDVGSLLLVDTDFSELYKLGAPGCQPRRFFVRQKATFICFEVSVAVKKHD